jgi:hypothetical protein
MVIFLGRLRERARGWAQPEALKQVVKQVTWQLLAA